MISLRRQAVALPILAATAIFGACATNDLTQPNRSGPAATADRDRGSDKDSKKSGPCLVSARVVVDQFGNATLEVRSGTFDNTTNTGVPYGTIQGVAYTVKSPAGRRLLDAEARVRPPNALFTTSLTDLQPAGSSHEDDDRHSSSKSIVTPALLFDPSDSVLVTAVVTQPSVTSTSGNRHHEGESDGDEVSGRTCTASVVAVVLKPTDVALATFERVVDGGAAIPAPSFGNANPGTPYGFNAWVTSPAGSLPADVACSATVTGTAGAAAYQLTWLTQQIHVIGGGKEACRFTLAFPTPDTYIIRVTAASAGDPNGANNTSTGTIVVKPNGQTIDVFVRSIVMDLGGGSTAPLGQIKTGVASQYVAAIGATKDVGNVTSSPVTCSVTVTNLGTGVVSNVVGTVTGQASTTADALCRFSLILVGSGDADQDYRIDVTAQPTAAADIATGNNTFSATQTAIVRVDVSVNSVQLTVDTVIQTGLTNIPNGKTGHYKVTFLNTSDRDATITCAVTAGAPGTAAAAVPLIAGSPARLLIPKKNGTAFCSFDYTFPQIMAVNFTVTATDVTPKDENPGNNVFSFQTTAVSDHTFPAIDVSNVHALQAWVTDSKGVPTILNEETANITRITLTFAATTTVLGDFTLSGTVTTDAPPTASHPIDTLSKATWTVSGLTPRSCRTGVDPGYRAVNGQTLTLTICAEDVPGDPTTQAISIEYGSSSQGLVGPPDPLGLFGTQVTFDVSLGWKLFGSTTSDHAGATVQFEIQDVPTSIPNVFRKTNTGHVIVTRNGG